MKPYHIRWRLVFCMISELFAVFMITWSYKAYVLLGSPVTQEDVSVFWGYVRDALFFYFWVVYLHYEIRYGFCALPCILKRRLAMLLITSILWMLLVETVSRKIMDKHVMMSPFLIWLADSVYYVPFLLPWKFWGGRRLPMSQPRSGGGIVV